MSWSAGGIHGEAEGDDEASGDVEVDWEAEAAGEAEWADMAIRPQQATGCFSAMSTENAGRQSSSQIGPAHAAM